VDKNQDRDVPYHSKVKEKYSGKRRSSTTPTKSDKGEKSEKSEA
jgi:hypothetical protein